MALLKLPDLASLVKARQRAIEDFVDSTPGHVLEDVREYRVLKIKENEFRRREKAVWLGVAKTDIMDGAGFAYEGTEALSKEEIARLEQLEKTKHVLGYLSREAEFRRNLFRQEDKAFAKQAKRR